MMFFVSIQAEAEVSQLTRKRHSVEEQLERTEERLLQTTTKLDEASHTADERERLFRLKFNKIKTRISLLEQEKC
jgi:hypothetical protein